MQFCTPLIGLNVARNGRSAGTGVAKQTYRPGDLPDLRAPLTHPSNLTSSAHHASSPFELNLAIARSPFLTDKMARQRAIAGAGSGPGHGDG